MNEEMALQEQAEALAREREMLEERVRGLMWLVTALEQGGIDPSQLASMAGSGDRDGGDPANFKSEQQVPRTSSSTEVEGRSSTSTERAVSYLPYAR